MNNLLNFSSLFFIQLYQLIFTSLPDSIREHFSKQKTRQMKVHNRKSISRNFSLNSNTAQVRRSKQPIDIGICQIFWRSIVKYSSSLWFDDFESQNTSLPDSIRSHNNNEYLLKSTIRQFLFSNTTNPKLPRKTYPNFGGDSNFFSFQLWWINCSFFHENLNYHSFSRNSGLYKLYIGGSLSVWHDNVTDHLLSTYFYLTQVCN